MERSEVYQSKLNDLKNAFNDFKTSYNINFRNFTDQEKDIFKNGQVQKFEFTVELLWKVSKEYLYIKLGKDVNAPKLVIKELFKNQIINQETYEKLFQMINDRNILSHVYDLNMFMEIYSRIQSYIDFIENIITSIERNKN